MLHPKYPPATDPADLCWWQVHQVKTAAPQLPRQNAANTPHNTKKYPPSPVTNAAHLCWRWVHEVKVEQVVDAHGLHGQHSHAEVGPAGLGNMHSDAELGLAGLGNMH